MNQTLIFDADWELLETGPSEIRACFAAFGIRYGERWLTEADDRLAKRTRSSVYLSVYPLARWLAWNWWRLRWEPSSKSVDWALTHRLTNVGDGYVWPNITFTSDGKRVIVSARPTQPDPAANLRYISDFTGIINAVEFESAIDLFLGQVQEQLRSEGVPSTDFDRIWDAVREERADSESVRWRRLEAMLGFDPDEADSSLIERLIEDAAVLGEEAVQEIAATKDHVPPTRQILGELSRTLGVSSSPVNTVRLTSPNVRPRSTTPAWQFGVRLATALRAQENLGDEPLSNQKLAEMSGVQAGSLSTQTAASTFSFALDESKQAGHVVLRSKFEEGRRFDLARLLGDRVYSNGRGKLFPATTTYTYRQKLQRAFAAELLCPFNALTDMLKGDYSSNAIETAAHHFNVSEMTVQTLLVNHRKIGREGLNDDPEAVLAA